jgi:hypothetical protein
MKIPFATLWAAGFLLMFGVAKAVFALYMILVTTVLGVATGPASLLFPNSVELVLGCITAVTAVYFFARRPWARRLVRYGWAPLVFFELGRALGLQAGDMASGEAVSEVLKTVGVLLLLLSAGLCANSAATETYLTSSSPKASSRP